ncbi:MAG TPA: hypothetical protein VGQ57_05465 [Polyangiaceae bacterium]|nr:hypothetical protein [Polyangiaceae bacterium]
MARGRGLLLSLSLVLCAQSAHAEPTRFSDRFFRGTTPGELPTAKVAVVGSLYAGAVASITFGVLGLARSGSKHDDAESFKQSQPPGFCNDLSSAPCASYRDLLDDQRRSRNMGYLLLGTGGLLALSGALTAELWHNAPPRVALELRPGTLALSLSGQF